MVLICNVHDMVVLELALYNGTSNVDRWKVLENQPLYNAKKTLVYFVLTLITQALIKARLNQKSKTEKLTKWRYIRSFQDFNSKNLSIKKILSVITSYHTQNKRL